MNIEMLWTDTKGNEFETTGFIDGNGVMMSGKFDINDDGLVQIDYSKVDYHGDQDMWDSVDAYFDIEQQIYDQTTKGQSQWTSPLR